MASIKERLASFKRKYPGTVAWRLSKHAKVVEEYLNEGEEVIYAFCAQKNNEWYDIFTTAAVVLTNKRLLVGQKRVVWGSFFNQITPDMYNDMEVYRGLMFGKVIIDTLKEELVLSNISKKALIEIETNVSEFMMREKKKYAKSGGL